jgi:hypothetical protein
MTRVTIPAAIILAVVLHLAGCDQEPIAGEPRDRHGSLSPFLPLP